MNKLGGERTSLLRRHSLISGGIHKNRVSEAGDMSVEAMVQKMIDDLTAALGDAAKHDKGNSAAGTRVRQGHAGSQGCCSGRAQASPSRQERLIRRTSST